MRRTIHARVLALAAAGLVATVLPMTTVVPAAHAEQEFGGYSTEAVATPIKIEVYEPVVPVPAQPQLELEVAYAKVESASGPTGTGVASWLWPGDPVGQGCKTFVEQLGLGETGLCADGYPVQVNSQTPGGPEKDSDEPFPGSLMRTAADADQVSATVGWSTDGDVSEREQKEGDSPLPEPPADPVRPAEPDLPDLSGGLAQLGDAITGRSRPTAAEEEPDSGLPPELAVLVDVDGMVSTSRAVTGDTVETTSRSKLSNLSLLGGLITADSVVVTSASRSDGNRARANGISRVVGLEVAGTPVSLGRNGVEAAGEKAEWPGLPDDPVRALEQLGVSIVLPKGERTTGEGSGGAAFEGLQVVIDTRPLRSHLDDVPFAEILGLVPDEAAELRNLLGAATQLAPKLVITAGNAATEVNTVPELELDLPDIDASDLNGAAAPPGDTGAAAGAGAAGGTGAAGAAAPDLAGESAAAGDSDGTEALAADPMSAGLPPLASIPGALTVGGIALAGAIGMWLRKIGAFVLGGAGSCSHGLETGVPDLRKA